MQVMKTAAEALEAIQESAKSADPEVRTMRRLKIGSVIHQGDVYLHRVPDDHPRGELLGTRQVAVGNTVGARHVVEGDNAKVFRGVEYPEGFEEPEGCQPGALLGPVVVDPGTLTHPEHAHHCIPTGTYQVTYQYNTRTMRAVQD